MAAMLQPDAERLNAQKEKERKSPRPKGGRVNPKARTKWTDELVTDTESTKSLRLAKKTLWSGEMDTLC